MALPVLDGNQSATTLSSVVTGGEHIVAHSVVCFGSTAISNITNAVSGSVVSISNFPSTQTIAGTVTANVVIYNVEEGYDEAINQNVLAVHVKDLSGNVLGSSGSPLPISGTVTVSNATTASAVFVKICGEQSGAGSNEAREIQTDDGGFLYVRLTDPSVPGSKAVIYDPVAGNSYVNVRQTSSVTIGSLPAISGTVTANNPSGALTTRFGSVVTANQSFITSAVTNTSRKYLLAQNISTGTVTIGIGFSPTTTQGIQLTAGAGLTFDAFCPTGAVYWLGAVTGAAWTILEG